MKRAPEAYLRVRETCKVGIEIEDDPVDGSRQCDSTHQQNEQHDVGEGGCEVSSLWGRNQVSSTAEVFNPGPQGHPVLHV